MTVAGSATPTRILITGAAGFLGRALVRAAISVANSGDLEIVACDVARGESPIGSLEHSRVRWKALDLRCREACMQLFLGTLPTHVLHAAAVTVGPKADMAAVNVAGTESVLAASAACGSVQRVLLVSSSAVYGAPRDEQACTEDHPLDLSGTYARTKWEAEQLLLRWREQTGTSVAAARLGPCYGLEEEPGQFRPGISLVAALLRALRTGTPLRVSGEDYQRDWTDVDDAAHALLLLLLAPRLRHAMYNVSDGVAISALDLVHCFRDSGAPLTWTDVADADLVFSATDGRKPLVIDRLCAETGIAPTADWRQRIATMIQTVTRNDHVERNT